MLHKILDTNASNIDAFNVRVQQFLDQGWRLVGEMKVVRATPEVDAIVVELIKIED